MTTPNEIELGELVTVIGGEFDGLSGTLDNTWMNEGVLNYVVVFSDVDGDFAYATEIKRFK